MWEADSACCLLLAGMASREAPMVRHCEPVPPMSVMVTGSSVPDAGWSGHSGSVAVPPEARNSLIFVGEEPPRARFWILTADAVLASFGVIPEPNVSMPQDSGQRVRCFASKTTTLQKTDPCENQNTDL